MKMISALFTSLLGSMPPSVFDYNSRFDTKPSFKQKGKSGVAKQKRAAKKRRNRRKK